MMAYFWQNALLFGLAAAAIVNADIKVDCMPDSVSVVWTGSHSQVDPSLLRLGGCPPASISAGEAFFQVKFSDCGFRRLVTGDQIEYSNDLAPVSSIDATKMASSSHLVICAFERPIDWLPPMYNPVLLDTYGEGELVFHLVLANDDFTGPALSTAFPLGSLIPIVATVEQQSHQPLLLVIDECVATTAPELLPESKVYPLITNEGCFVDSKGTRSRFEQRVTVSELRMYIQAFKFAVGEEVFLHCQLVAWDPSGLDISRKACHYVKGHGWELLDDPSASSLCGCCESSCAAKRTRRSGSGNHGVSKNLVLGPITVSDSMA